MSHQFRIQNKHEIEWDSTHWFCYNVLDHVICFITDNLPSWAICCNEGDDSYSFETSSIEKLLSDIKEGEVEFPFENIPKTDIERSKYTKEKFNNELIKFLEKLIELGKLTGGFSYIDVFY